MVGAKGSKGGDKGLPLVGVQGYVQLFKGSDVRSTVTTKTPFVTNECTARLQNLNPAWRNGGIRKEKKRRHCTSPESRTT